MTDETEVIHHGLDGVVVDTTRISKVMPEINSLVYRGYPVQELAGQCSFEEVAWLIWHGELPNASELKSFQAGEQAHRNISPALLDVIHKSSRAAHPMDVLRTAVSFLGVEDAAPEKTDAAANLNRAVDLLAKIPTVIGAFYRLRKGQNFIPPRGDLSIAENFFHVCFGKVPAPEETDAAANLNRAVDLLAKIPTVIGAFYRLRKGQNFIPPRGDLSIAENFFHVCFGKVPAPEETDAAANLNRAVDLLAKIPTVIGAFY